MWPVRAAVYCLIAALSWGWALCRCTTYFVDVWFIEQMPLFTLTVVVCVLETRSGDVQQIIMSFLYSCKRRSNSGRFDRWGFWYVWLGCASWENSYFTHCVMIIWAIHNSYLVRWIILCGCCLLTCVPALCDALWGCYVCEASVCWNHLQALLMEVAVAMRGEGLLCVCRIDTPKPTLQNTCVSLTLHWHLLPEHV